MVSGGNVEYPFRREVKRKLRGDGRGGWRTCRLVNLGVVGVYTYVCVCVCVCVCVLVGGGVIVCVLYVGIDGLS